MIQNLILSLMIYASDITGLPMTKTPTIIQTTQQELQKMDNSYHKGYIYGAEKNGTIWLTKNFNPDNPRDQSILLHEIVHVLQDASHKKYSCTGKQEKEAYDVQQKWLIEHNLNLKKDMNIDPLWLIIITRCN